MAKINCLPTQVAEKLKKAFRDGDISVEKLFEMESPTARLEALKKYLPEAEAKFFLAKLERGIMMPHQTQAIKNTLLNMFGHKPLYKGVSIENATKMANNLKMPDLKAMDIDTRAKVLAKYLDDNVATTLARRFEDLKKTGNLHLWESKTLGTDKLRNDKKLKGSLTRLEHLNDLGVLSPKDLQSYMGNFVEDRLGVNLTMEEAKKLGELVEKNTAAFDKMTEINDYTWRNKEAILDYHISSRDLIAYEQELAGLDTKGIINTAIETGRNHILASLRIFINSALYQVLPTFERLAVNAVRNENIVGRNKGVLEYFKAQAHSLQLTKADLHFVKEQFKMSLEIYNKTGIDISRYEGLSDGFNYFGGEKIPRKYKSPTKISEAEGIKAKAGIALQNYVALASKIPGYTTGGTDFLMATIIRYMTALKSAKSIAYFRAGNKTFSSEAAKRKWMDEEAARILKDSYSPTPETHEGKVIRDFSMMDANVSNNTQTNVITDALAKWRDSFNLGGVKVGVAGIPYLKIPATALVRSGEIASGPIGITYRIHRMREAAKLADPAKAQAEYIKQSRLLTGNIGFFAAAAIMFLFVADNDYISPFASNTQKEKEIAKAKGGEFGMVRFSFGKDKSHWIPMKYLPLVNTTLMGLLEAKKSIKKAQTVSSWTGGYLKGMITNLLEAPMVSDVHRKIDKYKNATSPSSSDLVDVLNKAGLDGDSLVSFTMARALPSTISHDLFKLAFPPKAKYDFLGEEMGKNRKWYGFRADKSNEIITEFERLHQYGFMPAITDPASAGAKATEEKLGDGYEEYLSRLKKNYADAVSRLINTNGYKKLPVEDKMKAINKLRDKYIMEQLDKAKK